MIACGRCSFQELDDSRFCSECGNPLHRPNAAVETTAVTSAHKSDIASYGLVFVFAILALTGVFSKAPISVLGSVFGAAIALPFIHESSWFRKVDPNFSRSRLYGICAILLASSLYGFSGHLSADADIRASAKAEKQARLDAKTKEVGPNSTAEDDDQSEQSKNRRQEQRRKDAANFSAEKQARPRHLKAIFTCGFSGVNHVSMISCIGTGQHGVTTALEIRNGDSYNLYTDYTYASIGKETREGFLVDLKDVFEIKIQNNSELILGLTIVDVETGEKFYEKKVTQFGVLAVHN